MRYSEKDELAYYFIADLHLAENRPDITACFLSFLENDLTDAKALYILGDLFEYWLGDDDDSQFVSDIATGLKVLNEKGIAIYFIHGNRDFLLGKKYAARAGITLLPEVESIELFTNKVVIMHGDTLCTKDVAYQAFRKKSRSWWWQTIVKNLPLFIRRKMAENYRRQSASATAVKSQEIMDVTPNEVIQTLEEHQSQLLIHGHTHRPATHKFIVNNSAGTRIVLGDWYQQGSYLKIRKHKVELMNKGF